MTADVAGETLELLPEKVLFWPRRRTVFVADLHWGKAAAFLAAGVPVPQDDTARDLARLTGVLSATAAGRLVILGDLFHARAGKVPHLFAAVERWRAQHSRLEVVLVRGNHDRSSGDPPAAWRFGCAAEPVFDPPFACRHYPDPTPGYYTLCGHVHPSATIRGKGRQRLRLPCFHFGRDVGVLPAFGGFTGTAAVTPGDGDRVYAVAGSEVIAISGPERR